MALQREVRVALRPRDDGMVVLRNTNPQFPVVEFEIEPAIPAYAQGSWGTYAKAPANELARRFAIWRGLEGVVASDIPVAAGLSSSSALVNAVGLALANINEVSTEVRAFAPVMADAYRRRRPELHKSRTISAGASAKKRCARCRATSPRPTSRRSCALLTEEVGRRLYDTVRGSSSP